MPFPASARHSLSSAFQSSAEAPAGARMVSLGYALQMDATDLGEAFAALWEPLGGGGLRWLGCMPLEALKARSGY